MDGVLNLSQFTFNFKLFNPLERSLTGFYRFLTPLAIQIRDKTLESLSTTYPSSVVVSVPYWSQPHEPDLS